MSYAGRLATPATLPYQNGTMCIYVWVMQDSSLVALGSWSCSVMGFTVRCGQKASSFVGGGVVILIVNIHRSPPLGLFSFLIEESSNFSIAGTVIDTRLIFSILGACWTWKSHCFFVWSFTNPSVFSTFIAISCNIRHTSFFVQHF